MLKKTSIGFGIGFLMLSFLTIFLNPIIGRYGFFYTDFVHNMIHLLSGVLLMYIIFEHENLLSKILRFLGFFYVAFAILGALSIGASHFGMFLGIGANGADHILHLIVGVSMIVLGTKEIRIPEEVAEAQFDHH